MRITLADLRSDEIQKKTDEELYKGIAFGVGHKQHSHAFAERGMSINQVIDVVQYIRGLAERSGKS